MKSKNGFGKQFSPEAQSTSGEIKFIIQVEHRYSTKHTTL